MEKIVTGCNNCPFCGGDYPIYHCDHPGDVKELFLAHDDETHEPVTAETCPLKIEPITIKLIQP